MWCVLCFLLQVAIKIIDKTQLNPTSLQKVNAQTLHVRIRVRASPLGQPIRGGHCLFRGRWCVGLLGVGRGRVYVWRVLCCRSAPLCLRVSRPTCEGTSCVCLCSSSERSAWWRSSTTPTSVSLHLLTFNATSPPCHCVTATSLWRHQTAQETTIIQDSGSMAHYLAKTIGGSRKS